jgi:hypothetical protein
MTDRERFEQWISSEPMGYPVARYDDSDKSSWPGQYADLRVQLAWEAWQEASKQSRQKELL